MSVRPFEVDISKAWERLSGFDVVNKGLDRSAHGAIESVRRHDNPSLEFETLAQFVLPHGHRSRIAQWAEDVVQQDLVCCSGHAGIVS